MNGYVGMAVALSMLLLVYWAGCIEAETADVDGARFSKLDQSLPATQFHAVLVMHRGEWVYEKYLSGEDEDWGRPLGVVTFGPDTLHDLRSATKSIVSMLTGIAIEEGHIDGLDSRVDELLPGDTVPTELTLRHLLTMTAGLEWNEMVAYTNPANDELQMSLADRPYRFVLDKPAQQKPGKVFNYNGGLTQLLVEILEQNTGQPIEDYAREQLFEPLGIERYSWKRHRNGQAWGASGLRLSATDFARLGMLYLQNGFWQGKSVVPASWVEQSYRPWIDADLPVKFDYSLHWWIPGYERAGEPIQVLMAQGNGGQYLVLFPQYELLIVTLGGYYNQFLAMGSAIHGLVLRDILPAVGIDDVSISYFN